MPYTGGLSNRYFYFSQFWNLGGLKSGADSVSAMNPFPDMHIATFSCWEREKERPLVSSFIKALIPTCSPHPHDLILTN